MISYVNAEFLWFSEPTLYKNRTEGIITTADEFMEIVQTYEERLKGVKLTKSEKDRKYTALGLQIKGMENSSFCSIDILDTKVRLYIVHYEIVIKKPRFLFFGGNGIQIFCTLNSKSHLVEFINLFISKKFSDAKVFLKKNAQSVQWG